MAKLRILATKKAYGKTFYRVSDGMYSVGWFTADTVAEIRRKMAKKPKK